MKRSRFLCIALLGAVASAPVRAQTIQTVAGTPFYAPAIGNFSTLGSDLLGLLVSGRFSDGQTFTANWGNLGGGLSGVNFAGRFRLAIGTTTNTWANPFTLTVYGTGNTLQSLTLNGASGPVIFDRTFGGASGTVESQLGSDFAFSGTTDLWNTLITYQNSVRMVGSSVAVGDIFETMVIDFRTGVTGTATGRNVRFTQDFDNIITGGLLLPVPEPETFGLTAVGLSLMLLLFWRRRRELALARAKR